MFDLAATIEVSPEQTINMIIYAIEKKYGFTITSDQVDIQYDGSYDTLGFAGYKIRLKPEELRQMGEVVR